MQLGKLALVGCTNTREAVIGTVLTLSFYREAPWDSQDGDVRPPLKELIEVKKFPIPTSGRAIVPGCGRGCEQ